MALLRYLTKGKSALSNKSTCASLTRKEVDSANECVKDSLQQQKITPSRTNHLCTYVLFYACGICTEIPPNLNQPIFLFRPLGTKPSNLKIANISGYTVCSIMPRTRISNASLLSHVSHAKDLSYSALLYCCLTFVHISMVGVQRCFNTL